MLPVYITVRHSVKCCQYILLFAIQWIVASITVRYSVKCCQYILLFAIQWNVASIYYCSLFSEMLPVYITVRYSVKCCQYILLFAIQWNVASIYYCSPFSEMLPVYITVRHSVKCWQYYCSPFSEMLPVMNCLSKFVVKQRQGKWYLSVSGAVKKITKKYFSSVFYTLFLNIYFFFFGEMKNNIVMSIFAPIFHGIIVMTK